MNELDYLNCSHRWIFYRMGVEGDFEMIDQKTVLELAEEAGIGEPQYGTGEAHEK